MKAIDKIKEIIKRSTNIEELIAAIKKEEISAIYMRLADEKIKKEQGINPDETWHRFFVEASATPVNKWENITNYSVVLISDDLKEMKVIEKS